MIVSEVCGSAQKTPQGVMLSEEYSLCVWCWPQETVGTWVNSGVEVQWGGGHFWGSHVHGLKKGSLCLELMKWHY